MLELFYIEYSIKYIAVLYLIGAVASAIQSRMNYDTVCVYPLSLGFSNLPNVNLLIENSCCFLQ